MAGKRRPRPPSRPRSVTFVGWLEVVQALGALGLGLAFTLSGGAALGGVDNPLLLVATGDPLAELERGLTLLLLSFPILWVSFGLFRMKAWAWLFAMTLQGVVLLVNLFSYFRGRANYFSMALSIVIVFCLNQAEVRQAFKARPPLTPLTRARETE